MLTDDIERYVMIRRAAGHGAVPTVTNCPDLAGHAKSGRSLRAHSAKGLFGIALLRTHIVQAYFGPILVGVHPRGTVAGLYFANT
jgi:hypothetical protein